ncbi:hypothetical protein AX15_007230 [Amanita polypyramis BW_CC]|nr:hypothetical protein AX15_007230 [Amanita polypyramis BW_CC]
MSTADDADHPQHHPQPPLHRSASHQKPKGILKNAPHSQSTAHSLQWDEENLALTEIQKDSLMKITEPKTPFVRYNPETDEVEGEIPNLDLGGRRCESPPASPTISSTGADTSGPSSRRTSFSSLGRPGSNRSASASSSRSTSFSLPNDAKKEIGSDSRSGAGEEVETEEEMDEETAEKHAAFVRARWRHYSKEADAMKLAKQLIENDNEEDDDKTSGNKEAKVEGDEGLEAPRGEEIGETPGPKVNGV